MQITIHCAEKQGFIYDNIKFKNDIQFLLNDKDIAREIKNLEQILKDQEKLNKARMYKKISLIILWNFIYFFLAYLLVKYSITLKT